MKKRLLSAVLAAALTMTSSAVFTAAQAADTAPDTTASAENTQTKNYWIFYKNIDTTAIDRIASEKQHDYEYSLYETETDQREVERKSVDYYQKIRLEMLKEAFAKKSAEVLAELGVDASYAWCSQFTPTIVCALTDAQYEKAKAMDIITEINVYEPLNLEPLTDIKDALTQKEDIIKNCTLDENGAPLCDEHIKFDVQFNGGQDKNIDYLVVYGLKSKNEIKTVKNQLSRNYIWDTPTMELYNGVVLESNISRLRENRLCAIIFVEDELPGFGVSCPLETYSKGCGFDVAPYIINLGDGNGDGKINAVDASSALSIYAEVQSNKDKAYTADQLKHLDVDGSETVTAVDASALLSYYAYTSTGGEELLKDFLKS